MTDQLHARPMSESDGPLAATGAPRTLPSIGGAFPVGKWFWLKMTYKDERGNTVVGFADRVGANAATSFWDYVCIRRGTPGASSLKFKVDGEKDGWPVLRLSDGNVLSVKATGWVYRSSAYPIGWSLDGNQLVCTYWGGPLGVDHHRFLVSDAWYLGFDLPPVQVEVMPAE